ncbi:hypothetical protein BP5796_00984 [Coleophoma crateriformis]|uniref:F-box domain-containing protein n=1 Tax=Coleophoma crateriformis TaxID=565419 RepID=A0A3D8T9X2_9HELO|nr:hypothetical protein BP5796_00984 [Coleophoma crateriformis]
MASTDHEEAANSHAPNKPGAASRTAPVLTPAFSSHELTAASVTDEYGISQASDSIAARSIANRLQELEIEDHECALQRDAEEMQKGVKQQADLDVARKEREAISDESIQGLGICVTDEELDDVESEGFMALGSIVKSAQAEIPRHCRQHGFIESLSDYPELIMELARHLKIRELLALYRISRDFHIIVNSYFTHVLKNCALEQAPESAKIFNFRFYEPLTIPDPMRYEVNNTDAVSTIRRVPGLKWLQMVIHRDKVVRDILACLAREGHRVPPETSISLKKAWLVMDVSTTTRRVQLMHNEKFMTDKDLFNLQLFIVKLDMRFNDPFEGQGSESMRKLLLGQKGLTTLCKVLKREMFLSRVEVIKAFVRYSFKVRPEHQSMSIWDIPPAEIGLGHLEGWGKGRGHLMRMDELVPREATRRRLRFKDWIMHMMLYGYVDAITGKDTPPTEDEMYMSDDEDPHKNGI